MTANLRVSAEAISQYADCCAGISQTLLIAIKERLPQDMAMILSVGCGSGRLEALLLDFASQRDERHLNLYGVEVPSCIVKHLPEERVLRVPNSESVHPDGVFASTLMFVYPRSTSLIALYLEAFVIGALEQVIWLSHRSDWPETADLLHAAGYQVDIVDDRGIAEYELLAIATRPNLPTETMTNESTHSKSLHGKVQLLL